MTTFPPIATEVTLLHLGIWLCAELGCVNGAGCPASTTALLAAQAHLLIDDDDAIRLSFVDGSRRAGWNAGWLSTVITGGRKKSYGNFGIMSFFPNAHPP
jgi:hypothetical protein